jgi:hypothetical protein
MTTFPSQTELVVGPGDFKATAPGYPTDSQALALGLDTSGRPVLELTFEEGTSGVCQFSSFTAYDYFDDGLFYLLNAPDHGICHGELIHHIHLRRSDCEPFFQPSFEKFPNYDAALQTINTMQEIEADGDVLMIIAHDHTLLGQISLCPEKTNAWKAAASANKTRWRFCFDFM